MIQVFKLFKLFLIYRLQQNLSKKFVRNRKNWFQQHWVWITWWKYSVACDDRKNLKLYSKIFDMWNVSFYKFWNCYVFWTFQSKVNYSANILSHNAYILFLFLEIKWSNFKSQSIFIDLLGESREESSAWAGWEVSALKWGAVSSKSSAAAHWV